MIVSNRVASLLPSGQWRNSDVHGDVVEKRCHRGPSSFCPWRAKDGLQKRGSQVAQERCCPTQACVGCYVGVTSIAGALHRCQHPGSVHALFDPHGGTLVLFSDAGHEHVQKSFETEMGWVVTHNS